MHAAEREVEWARANLPALEARIAAENAKYAVPQDARADELAATARRLERQAALLKAEADLTRAQAKLSEATAASAGTDEKAEKAREKRAAEARKEIQAATAALSQATEKYTSLGATYPETSSGRRSALARWIVSRENPLAARVAINHIWTRHFGRGLVSTPNNFGLSGKAPSHPELLDWLAVEFMDRGWSTKAMHRLIVTSNTYRMQSGTRDPSHPGVRIDPENQYLWRMNPRRMEAETVRDSILQVAGQLDLTTGGPELEEGRDQEVYRRSVYFRHSAEAQVEFLKLFDAANPQECYERKESVIPQQALALANSRLVYNQARLLARRLSSQAARDMDFVDAAFEQILGRTVTPPERAECERFVREQASLFLDADKARQPDLLAPGDIAPARDPKLRAREGLIHALFNRNEFVTVR